MLGYALTVNVAALLSTVQPEVAEKEVTTIRY